MPPTITLFTPHELSFHGKIYPCASGKGGIKIDKIEGDGATPVGTFSLRRVFYRADRLPQPETSLPVTPIHRDDGWCDDPKDPAYNQLIKLPYAARHENLWHEAAVYDIIVVIGYNDDPVVPNKGSAIFMHLARENYTPTEGCIALNKEDLLEVLKFCTRETLLSVQAP